MNLRVNREHPPCGLNGRPRRQARTRDKRNRTTHVEVFAQLLLFELLVPGGLGLILRGFIKRENLQSFNLAFRIDYDHQAFVLRPNPVCVCIGVPGSGRPGAIPANANPDRAHVRLTAELTSLFDLLLLEENPFTRGLTVFECKRDRLVPAQENSCVGTAGKKTKTDEKRRNQKMYPIESWIWL